MLLVYTQKITPRITFVFKHICTQVLGFPVSFTSKIEEFVAYEGMKLSYGRTSLGNDLFFQNVDLLLEQGVADLDIKVQDWEGIPCFFAVSESSAIPFDIFAASFFLLSRYEEYLPHVKDREGRFKAAESLGFKGNFLEIPVIDVWALRFRKLLQHKYPQFKFPKRHFSSHNIIAVTEAYSYRKKGIVRVILGMLHDLVHLKPWLVLDRWKVMLNFKQDPYDIYSRVLKFLKKYKINLKFMFQVSDFSALDRNINHNRLEFQSLIKSVADYAEVGLQPGFYATCDAQLLKQEKARLENIIKRPVLSALNSKYNLFLPDTYNNMVELEFKNDFSMGYPDGIGFRAGTCTPFFFYDINFEVTTPLLLHPYALSIEALQKLKETEVEYKVREIKREVKLVEGQLISIFTNIDFSEYSDAKRNFIILKNVNEID